MEVQVNKGTGARLVEGIGLRMNTGLIMRLWYHREGVVEFRPHEHGVSKGNIQLKKPHL